MECIWVNGSSLLLLRVVIASEPVEDACVDLNHLETELTLEHGQRPAHLQGDVEADIGDNREDDDDDQSRPP